MHVDSVNHLAVRRSFPAATEKRDGVTAPSNSSKDFVEMKLGASGLRVFTILPIEDENLH
jgi:hypothetical protein